MINYLQIKKWGPTRDRLASYVRADTLWYKITFTLLQSCEVKIALSLSTIHLICIYNLLIVEVLTKCVLVIPHLAHRMAIMGGGNKIMDIDALKSENHIDHIVTKMIPLQIF